MRFKIYADPKFAFRVNKRLVDLLTDLASHHYDHTCRCMAKVGGLLFAWDSSLQMGLDDVHCAWRELDLLSKVMEMYHHLSDEDAKVIERFSADVREAMRFANAESKRWVVDIDTAPIHEERVE